MKIPADIQARILEKARRDWPDDYEMQKHTLEKQSEAYLSFNYLYSNLDSSEFVDQIFGKALSDWPDDYEMQLYTVNKQLDSATEFYQYDNRNIPNDIIDQIRLKASNEWPDDYEMRLYIMKNQVSAWISLHEFSQHEDVLRKGESIPDFPMKIQENKNKARQEFMQENSSLVKEDNEMDSEITCPHCYGNVTYGARVCRGCQAEIEYGTPPMAHAILLIVSGYIGMRLSSVSLGFVGFIAGAIIFMLGFFALKNVFKKRIKFKRLYMSK